MGNSNSHSFAMDIKNNNISKIKNMITKNKINVNEPITGEGYNLLHIALRYCNTELIYFLLDHPDIDVNYVSYNRDTILMSLYYGIDVYMGKYYCGITRIESFYPYSWQENIVRKRKNEIAERFTEFKSNIIKIAKKIIKKCDKYTINAYNKKRNTVLGMFLSLECSYSDSDNVYAIGTKTQKKLIKLLLDNGADINKPIYFRRNSTIHPLQLCNIMGGSYTILNYFIRKGANLWQILVNDYKKLIIDYNNYIPRNNDDKRLCFKNFFELFVIKKNEDIDFVFWKIILKQWLVRDTHLDIVYDVKKLYDILVESTHKYNIKDTIIQGLPQPIAEEILTHNLIDHVLSIGKSIVNKRIEKANQPSSTDSDNSDVDDNFENHHGIELL